LRVRPRVVNSQPMKASRSAHFHAVEPNSAQARLGVRTARAQGSRCFPRRCCALRDNAHAPADLGRAVHRVCRVWQMITPKGWRSHSPQLMVSSGVGTGAMWRLRCALAEGLRRAGNAMQPASSSLSSSVRAAMFLSRPTALRQSQSAHNSRLSRVRFHSECAWRSSQIPSISEVLSSRPCMTMKLARDAK
jgi:hypothetical protein